MFAIHRRKLGFRLAALALATGAVAVTGVIQASAQDLPAFTCTDKSGGAASAAGTVSDVRVAHHDGYDRLVIGFATASAMPQYQLNRQARCSPDGGGQLLRRFGFRAPRAVEPLRQADHDPRRLVVARHLCDARWQRRQWLSRHRRQRLRDGGRGVAEGDTDAF